MADVTYSRVNWEDSPSTDTPINATNLNKMDLGISQVVTRANASMPYANILDDWTDIGAVTTPNTYTADAMRVAELNTNLNVLVANIELDYANAVSMAPYTSSGNAFTVPKFGVLIGESGYAAAGSYRIYDLKATTITVFGQPKCIYAATVPMGAGSPINITIGKGSQIYVAMPSVYLYYVPFK